MMRFFVVIAALWLSLVGDAEASAGDWRGVVKANPFTKVVTTSANVMNGTTAGRRSFMLSFSCKQPGGLDGFYSWDAFEDMVALAGLRRAEAKLLLIVDDAADPTEYEATLAREGGFIFATVAGSELQRLMAAVESAKRRVGVAVRHRTMVMGETFFKAGASPSVGKVKAACG